MFNFMKKNTNPSSSASTSNAFDKEQEKEKDKRKKEKRKIDGGKKRDRAHLSTEEILRIDEVRRSLKIRGRRKDKEKLPSGITADYTASFLAGLVEHNGEDTVDQASTTSSLPFNTQESPQRSSLHLADPSSFTQSDTSSETSLTSSAGRPLPPLPPRPPKRGILKGSKNVISKSSKQVTRPPPATLPGISAAVVAQNTLQNEVISYENTIINGGIIPETAIPLSPDQESLSDTTNSSFATPPLSLSPEGKAQGLYPHSANIECPLPKLRQISLPPPRDVILHRSGPSGEFGLSLRRAIVPSSSPNHPPTSLVLAEPGQMASLSNGSHRLLPGDRLNQVNDIEVKNKPREEIIQIIRSAGSVLKIQVEPIVELSEFSKRLLISQEDDEKEKIVNNLSSNSSLSLDPCSSSGSGTLKRSASRRFYKDSSTARTESELLDSQSNEQSFWLMHRSGFSEATLVEDDSATPTSAVASPSSPAVSQDVVSGRVSVRLEATKQIITVHPDDLEKANPTSMDFCEDLCSLRHLNESSVLHTLRQRYGNHLVYTRAGSALIAINPAAPLPIYSDKLVPLLRGCKPEDTPPHIYSLAQQAFQQAMSTRRDQSIVFLGRSGSGSTSNAHRAMEYIAQAATPSVSGASIFSDRTNSVSSSVTLTQSSSSNFISSGKGTIGVDHLQAAWIVLEAFCNAQTPLNSNASRATQLWTLELDHSGFINAVSIQVLLLDRARVYRRRPSSSHPDNNFHVFYYLLAAACDDETPLPRDLQLQLNLQTRSHGQSPNSVATLVSNTGTSTTSGPTNSGNCILGWTRLVAAMHRLGFQENEMRVIWSVLAAIIHLGAAGVVKVGSRWQFGQPHWAQVACQLLGISFDDLTRILFNTTNHSNSNSSTNSNSPNSTPRTSSTNSTGIRTPSPETSNHPSLGGSGIDNLEGLLGSWYGELVGLVLSLVNRNLSSTSHGVCSILLLDTPGFQNPSTSSLQNFGTLEDLWTNYLHERLQGLMEHHLLAQPRSKYLQEQITIDLDDELLDEYQLVGFLDREPRPWAPMSNLLRHSSSPSSNTNSSNNNSHANNNHYTSPSGSSGSNNHDSSVADSLDTSEKPGLLWIIDHEAMMLPGTSDQQLLERIFNYYNDREDHLIIRRAPSGGTTSSCYLAVQHLRGTNPVLYSLNGWLRKSREHPVHTHAIALLHSTQRDEICQLFRGGSLHATSLPLGPGVADVVASASASAAAASLRRASSIRRTQAHAGAAIKRKSLCLQVKFTADAIIEILRKTSVFYVYTMIANQTPSINSVNDDLNVPMLRSQLRGSQLLPIMRLYKQGLPFAMRFGEFARRFSLLALPSESCAAHPVLAKLISRSSRCSLDEEKEAAKWLQEHIDGLEVSHCRLGSSQIFFRAGVLSQLEAQRDAKLTAFFIRLQAQCRGFLSRKKLAKLKVQDVAIRCVQRNVRKYLRVREWTWYRLYIHLSPLLLACRSETKYNEEVESLRTRVNKLEQERLALKHENERLDARGRKSSPLMMNSHHYQSTRKFLSPEPSNLSRLLTRTRAKSLTSEVYRYQRPSTTAPSSVSNGLHSSNGSYVSCRSTSRSPTPLFSEGPRRYFPQEASSEINLDDLERSEQSPVIFGAGLSFVLGAKRQRTHQTFRPTAAHLEPNTASNLLSRKINDFLKRSDHIMQEWSRLGHTDGEDYYPRQTKSAATARNIRIKGFQLYSESQRINGRGLRTPRSNMSISSNDDFDTNTLDEFDEISELSADLADEHSAATLASERLEAECAERARLEQEIQSVQMENKALQQSTERLETELHLVRSTELNDLEAALESSGTCEDQDLGNSGTGAALYKHRYERATRELELAKKRMQQQHEADLEQLVGLKKQMDKKLADAYEEVDEQRKVVAQWKRKVLKLTSEANDVRLLLEEQNSRNNLLEKKQRKFDSELQKLNEELRQERNQKERATRERDIITTEKQQVEQMLAALKLELDLKDEVIAERSKELDEMTFGGKSEEDFSLIKKQKADLEKKLEEQEDELDDLAGQVQLLEQAKIRLEMCLEQQRKEHRREMQQRDDELEEARSSSIKKLKALEMQLETEHEHKTNLLRARHELERRYQLAEERNKTIISKFEDTTAKLKRDLIRTKALLKDTQAALEQSRGENNPARVRLRSLKIQMEDLEIARDSALKSKQSLERDLLDTQSTLDECINARRDAEERGTAMARDLAEVKSQLDENEDELAEILKKYKTAVNQLSSEQKHVHEQIQLVSELESERQSLKDQIHELQTKLDHAMNMLRSSSVGSVASASGGPGATPVEGTRQDMKIRELESKLDLEKTTRSRLEVQITRLKESLEKTTKESTQAKTKEQQAQIELRRIQASIRTLNEQQASLKSKDNEFSIKLRDSERRAKIAETEAAAARRETEEMRARLESLTEALEKDVNESTDSNEEDSELSNIDDDEDEENHSQQRNFETSMESFRPGESSI